MFINAFLIRNLLFGYPENWKDSARVMAEIGLEFDKNCAECYKALGLLASNWSTTKEAIFYYEKAISINPNYEMAISNSISRYIDIGDFKNALINIKKLAQVENQFYFNLGVFNMALGNYEKAKIFIEKDVKIEKEPVSLWYLSFTLLKLKNIKRYQEVSKSLFEISGDTLWLRQGEIWTNWLMGNYQEVINYYEGLPNRSMSIEKVSSDHLAATYSYLKVDEIEMAKTISLSWKNKIMSRYSNNSDLIDDNSHLALLSAYYSLFGQKEEALNYMEKAIDLGYLEPWPFSEPFFDNLHDHPRFQELVEKQKKKREEVMALVATYNFPQPEDL